MCIGKFAEAVAADVSRRAFLSRFGRSSMASTAAVAALLSLALPAAAHGGRKFKCCAGRCQPPGPNCTLFDSCHNCNPFTYCRDCLWDCNGTYVETSCG
jgi:hypothetical protein